MTTTILELRSDLSRLRLAMRNAGTPSKLLTAISTKSLRTPRRQTGRIEHRTNRDPRWEVDPIHRDYSSEMDAHLVLLRLWIDTLFMKNAPHVDPDLIRELSLKYFPNDEPPSETKDPVTDEVLDWDQLKFEVVDNPTHGYSRFHIGHLDPHAVPKHRPDNVRWQLKESNDFQDGMDVRVARIAYLINRLVRGGDARLIPVVEASFSQLCADLGLVDPTLGT